MATSGGLVPAIKRLLQRSQPLQSLDEDFDSDGMLELDLLFATLQTRHSAAHAALLEQLTQLLSAPESWLKQQQQQGASTTVAADRGQVCLLPMLPADVFQLMKPDEQASLAAAVAESCSAAQLMLLRRYCFLALTPEQQLACCQRIQVRFVAVVAFFKRRDGCLRFRNLPNQALPYTAMLCRHDVSDSANPTAVSLVSRAVQDRDSIHPSLCAACTGRHAVQDSFGPQLVGWRQKASPCLLPPEFSAHVMTNRSRLRPSPQEMAHLLRATWSNSCPVPART